jgi:hypothetical protein
MLFSPILTGLLTGGMVVIQVVLLPFWRGMPPRDFRTWFSRHSDRIRSVMRPLGMGAAMVNLASTIALTADRRGNRPASAVATAATAGVIAITLAVNEPANDRFTGGALTDAETRDLLRTWALWHHARVVLGLAATVAATVALPIRKA